MGNPAILSVRIVGDAKGAVNAFNETDRAAAGLGGKLTNAVPAILGVATAVATVAIAVGTAVYDIGATFDDLEDTIRTGTGATGTALEGLTDSAKEVAAEIPATFEQIAPVIADLNTRTGLTGDTLERVASQYLEASRILGEEVDIKTTTSALAAFNVEGEKMESALDDIFRASQATGVGMNELADKAAANAPVLKELGFSLTDSVALIGSLDKAGLDSSKTLNAMNKALTGLAEPGENLQQTFRRSVDEIEAFIKVGDRAAALDLASDLFGVKGAGQMIQAIESGKLKWDDLMGSIGATADTILEVGEATSDASEKWQILKNKAMIALEPIADALHSGVSDALDQVIVSIENFDLESFKEGQPVVGDLIDSFTELGLALADLARTLDEELGPVLAELAPIVGEAFGIIGQYASDFISHITEVIRLVTSLIKGDWSGAWEHAKGAVSTAVDAIKNHAIGLYDLVAGVFNRFGVEIPKSSSEMWGQTATVFSNGINRAVSYVTLLPARAANAVRSGAWRMYSAGQDMISGAIDGIASMASRVRDEALSVFSDAVNSVKNFLGIRSPSRVFMEIGAFTGEGMVLGIKSQTRAIGAAYKEMLALPSPAQIPLAPLVPTHVATPASQTSPSINITVNGALDPESVARQIEDLLFHSRARRTPLNIGGEFS